MTDVFDPYHKWLGIPPAEQPPNHYRLLGIQLLEDDEDVISNAADQRMTHIRTFQMGEHSDLSQRLLSEISAARVFLHSAAKEGYDRNLRSSLPSIIEEPAPMPPSTVPQAGPRPTNVTNTIENVVNAPHLETPSIVSRTPRRIFWQTPVIAGGVVASVLGIVLLLVLLSRGDQKPKAVSDRQSTSGLQTKVPNKPYEKHAGTNESGAPRSTRKRASANSQKSPNTASDAGRPQDSLTLATLIEEIEPSIVQINARGERSAETGSGFMVDRRGTVVTNYHVVRGALSVYVKFRDGTSVPVEGFLLVDTKKDLAVLRIANTPTTSSPISIAQQLPRKGERVVALGAPRGFSFSATEGIISAIRTGSEVRDNLLSTSGADVYAQMGLGLGTTWLQTSTPISPGNSGGPLVNLKGEVVGINTWSHLGGQNLNFAVAAEELSAVLRRTVGEKVKDLAQLSNADETNIVVLEGDQIGLPNHKSLQFTGHNGPVHSITVSKNGRYVATAGEDKMCYLLDAKTLEQRHSFGPHNARLTGVAFMDEDTTIVVSSERDHQRRASVFFWSIKQDRIFKNLYDSDMDSYGLQVSSNGAKLAVALGGSSARLYLLSNQDRIGLASPRKDLPCKAVAFSPDSRFLYTASGPSVVRWLFDDTRKGSDGKFADNAPATCLSIALSRDGSRLFTGHQDSVLRSW
ncbi:MAG: trypsin-like peptidase domain-containing protein, partial [Pirellulales bacterium]